MSAKLCFARGRSALDSGKAFVMDMVVTGAKVLWHTMHSGDVNLCYSPLPASGKQGTSSLLLYCTSVCAFYSQRQFHGPSDFG